MSRKSSYYEQAIELCKKKIKEKTEYIEKGEICLTNMKRFDSSVLGKAIRMFCEQYTNGNFNKQLLTAIEEMIKSPELNPYEFEIDYDEPCKGEKLLYGKKFTTSHKEFGYVDAWFMYYHWDNYDLDDDIKKLQRSIKRSKKTIKMAKLMLNNATIGFAKFKDVIYSVDDISDMKEVLNTAKSITITYSEEKASTFNTIAVIQECMKEGIPVTIKHSSFPEQEINVRDTEFAVYDEWRDYERNMEFDDYEMNHFRATHYY